MTVTQLWHQIYVKSQEDNNTFASADTMCHMHGLIQHPVCNKGNCEERKYLHVHKAAFGGRTCSQS